MDRRTTLVLLAALLTSGCVAVPHPSAPGPSARGGEVSPAAVRPPSPLPAWPAPREAEPRETLAATGPEGPGGADPERTRAKVEAKGRAPAPVSSYRPKGTQPPPSRRQAKKPGQPTKPGKTAKPARTESPTGLRALCRQAEGSGAVPSGVVELCRNTYGR
ncbi:hypothetical protein ACGFYP_02060 [Streptomyces sp. NPDC048370]|uniref:hypothetical protein n=1 Tax=Streptomyces sp. NPDC048370 TaxID=3365540 RepID=UPI003722FF54